MHPSVQSHARSRERDSRLVHSSKALFGPLCLDWFQESSSTPRPSRSSCQSCVNLDLNKAPCRHIINNLSGSKCIPFTTHEHAIHNVRRVMKTEQHRRRSALGQSSEGKELNIESRSEERRVGKEGRSRWSPYQ